MVLSPVRMVLKDRDHGAISPCRWCSNSEIYILRKFRDSYVKEFHPEDVKTYYRTAPQIVKTISSMPNSTSIYEKMYSELVLGTIHLIKKSQLEKAYSFCKEYEENLMRVYRIDVL